MRNDTKLKTKSWARVKVNRRVEVDENIFSQLADEFNYRVSILKTSLI